VYIVWESECVVMIKIDKNEKFQIYDCLQG
jgi:hypothetical protein